MNKLRTLIAAMLLTTASAASAIGTYEYENFITSLDGNVGITSSYEYRGITLNNDPTVFGNLQLTGIDGTLEGFYIGANGIAIDEFDASTEYTTWIGWRTLDYVGWQYNVGIMGKFTDYDTINTNYGEVYGKIGYTWDNYYVPSLSYQINYTNDYYNTFGSLVYHNVKGSVSIPTSYNPVKIYFSAGYSDSIDDDYIAMRDYGDYKIGVSSKLGKMDTNLSVTWIDSKDDFVSTPFGTIDSDNNATVNLTVAYHF